MNEQAIEQAGEAADRIRGELLRTLEELDRRRWWATNWRLQLNRNRHLIAGAAGVLIAGVAAKIALSSWAKRRHLRHLTERRREALARGWNHPERVARPDPGFAAQVASSIAVFLTARTVSSLLIRAAKRVVD